MTEDELREIKNRWSCSGNGCATHEELGTSHGIECPKMTDDYNDVPRLLTIIDGLRERNADMCDVCAGTKKTLRGERCICSVDTPWDGTVLGLVDGLRRHIAKLEQVVERAQAYRKDPTGFLFERLEDALAELDGEG